MAYRVWSVAVGTALAGTGTHNFTGHNAGASTAGDVCIGVDLSKVTSKSAIREALQEILRKIDGDGSFTA